MQTKSTVMRRELLKYAPLVFAASTVGLAAFLASYLAIGRVEASLVNFSRFVGCLFVAYGYLYATTVWRVPGLHGVGLIAPLISFGILPLIILLGPQRMDLTGALLEWLWRITLVLIGMISVTAIAGWIRYFMDRRAGFQR